jgi:hypothetical protein
LYRGSEEQLRSVDKPAKALMERHILSALDDTLRYGISKRIDEGEGSNGIVTKSGAGG